MNSRIKTFAVLLTLFVGMMSYQITTANACDCTVKNGSNFNNFDETWGYIQCGSCLLSADICQPYANRSCNADVCNCPIT